MAQLIRDPQHVDGNSGENPKRVYHYKVRDTISPSVAVTLAMNDLGPYVDAGADGILYRGDPTFTQANYNTFDVYIEYIQRKKDIGSWDVEFDGTGATEHVIYSLSPVTRYPTAYQNNNYIIGRDKSGNIAGVDVPAQSGQLTVTFNHPVGVMTMGYAKYLSSLTNYVNSDTWLGFAPGEARFKGPRTKVSSDQKVSATYNFEYQPNKSNFTVGAITVTSKEGWDPAWVQDKDALDTVGGVNRGISEPEFVYVGRVSPRISFATAFGFS